MRQINGLWQPESRHYTIDITKLTLHKLKIAKSDVHLLKITYHEVIQYITFDFSLYIYNISTVSKDIPIMCMRLNKGVIG